MNVYSFTEAQPLMDFIASHYNEIVGHTIEKLYIDYWPGLGLFKHSMSDEPVVLEMDNGCIWLTYLDFSDLTINTGSKEELQQDELVEYVMRLRDEIINYFEYDDDSVKKEDIEGRTVTDISVDRFSSAFEYNIQGDMRPEGGDYFLTIRLHLDNGMRLCFCGSDAGSDGYICSWVETMRDKTDITRLFLEIHEVNECKIKQPE